MNCEQKLNSILSDVSNIKNDILTIKRDILDIKNPTTSSVDSSSTLDAKIDKLLLFMGIK